MKHPLGQISPVNKKRFFIILLILTVLLLFITNAVGAPLTTTSAPYGIVSFELAFTPARAEQIITSWSQAAQLRASFIQGLDFLFPLVYSAALGLGCLLSASVLSTRGKLFASLGGILAWGLILAAACDYIENVALITELFGRVQSPYPEVAGVCAVIKFTIILLAILYICYGLVIRLLSKSVGLPATG
jgi:hypothetical protein